MTDSVGQTLQKLRVKLGFLSARSFYMDLDKRAKLAFNYSYYMKIEADQLVPSEKIIAQISGMLPGANGDELVLAYCTQLFPSQMKRLTKKKEDDEIEIGVEKKTSKSTSSHLRAYQVLLTEKQVAIISSSETHYYLFLILSLSRRGIKLKDFKKYKFDNIEVALSDLISAKLIFTEDELYFPSSPEYVFPKVESESLKKLYQRLNEYDSKRNNKFGLQKKKRASFFKRISPRQAEILLMHLELLFQTIRVSDEQDVSYNTEVLSMELSYYQGKIVG